MNSIVGFCVYRELDTVAEKQLHFSKAGSLEFFKHLEQKSISIGVTHLDAWGHGKISERIHKMPDGSTLLLIGSPHEEISWSEVEKNLIKADRNSDFQLPWDGRVILLRISADGRYWVMWNDWLGSIPVFHTKVGKGSVASTLEPVVVASAGYTPDDFFIPGLISLLVNGHFISDWTLYKDMKVIPPDSAMVWDENGFHADKLHSVEPSQSRWETGWDDLVDEMHELSHGAITDILKTQSTWILPLSSGLDSRLIAGVAAEAGADVKAYAYGAADTTDALYSRQIAVALGIPWKRIELSKDFLKRYTKPWANLFGSGMHFHGMYQMAFLDEILSESEGRVLSGFLGDILTGDDIGSSITLHSTQDSCQILSDWYVNWLTKDVPDLVKVPVQEAMSQISETINRHIDSLSGGVHQKMQLLEIVTRQRFFTSFQSTVLDYWRGVANPFMNRDYARFCLSLPRAALDNRRLVVDVFRRYYGRLAVIPGTYANEPMILTGRYLLSRRIAKKLPKRMRRGPFSGFDNVQLRMDSESVQSIGKDALWPLFECMDKLSDWMNVGQLQQDYQAIMKSKEDIRPLRRLQAVQTLAYRLL